MKKKLAIINSDSMNCTYGGVAPFMRNMHPFFEKEFDVQYFYIPDSMKNNPLPGRIKIMWHLWRNKRKLKDFDFIISHVPEGSYVVSFFDVPYAHIYHGNDNPMTQSRYRFGKYFGFLFDIFFKRIKKTATLLYTVGPAYGNVKKLHNPICHNILPPTEADRSGFIFAGRLELIKNVDRLIKIYSKLSTDIQEANHLFIAGYGTQENDLKRLVSKLKLSDKIHFLGNLPNLQLIQSDSTKKILVMASSQEGMPTAIAEALSVGTPVITTDTGDIRSVIKNNYNGFIFPLEFKDEDYIKAIENILGDFNRFKENALKSSEVFRSEVITSHIIDDINKNL